MSGWEVMRAIKMTGAEADRVVAITRGVGYLEQISRAKLSLGIIYCSTERTRDYYNKWAKKAFCKAVEEGRVLAAIPPWHPEVRRDKVWIQFSF